MWPSGDSADGVVKSQRNYWMLKARADQRLAEVSAAGLIEHDSGWVRLGFQVGDTFDVR